MTGARRAAPGIVFALWLATVCGASAEEGGTTAFRLDNGLSVVLRSLPADGQAAVAVLHGIGTDHDPDGRSGFARLLGRALARGAEVRVGGGWTSFGSEGPSAGLDARLAEAAARLADPAPSEAEFAAAQQALAAPDSAGPPAMRFVRDRVRPGPPTEDRSGAAGIPFGEARERGASFYAAAGSWLVVAGEFDSAAVRARIVERFDALPAGDPLPAVRVRATAPVGGLTEPMPAAWAGGPSILCRGQAAPAPGTASFSAFLALAAGLHAACNPPPAKLPPGSPQPKLDYDPLDDPTALVLTLRHPLVDTGEASTWLDAFVAAAPAASADETARAFPALFDGSVPRAGILEVAWRLGRRAQLGVDPVALRKAIAALTPEALAAARAQMLGPQGRREIRFDAR